MLKPLRLPALISTAVLAAGVLVGTPSAAAPETPAWAEVDESVDARPADVVAEAPAGEPLVVVVTQETPTGPQIESIEVDSVAEARQVVSEAQDADDTIAVSMAQPVRMTASNDTHRPQQWALDRLHAEAVWKRTAGSGVKVAVIDTGVAANHPDLKGRVGAGFDFVRGTATQVDGNGHGTHVAGIIAATANNKVGVAGLAHQVSVVPVRVLDNDGNGRTDHVAAGIRWAANQSGVRVINLSLSGSGDDPAVASAVAYAQSRNVVVVAAAGNSGCPMLGSSSVAYPAAYAGVVGVGSVQSDLNVSSFSSCGSWVDVAAPGGQIMSTVITSSRGLGCASSAQYCSISGTSMASGFVSAQAALLAQVNPGWSWSQIASRMTSTADSRSPANRYGAGIINPAASLGVVPVAVPTGLRVVSTGVNSVDLAWNATSGATGYRLWYGTSSAGSGATFLRVTGATTARITGLKANTTYYVDIAAENSTTWSDYTPRLSFTTGDGRPAQPSNFRITATGPTWVDLAWNASSGATSYRIWHGTSSSGSGAKLLTVTGTSTRISGLKPGTRYYADIAAANASGWSSYTPRISGVTTGAAASPVPATPSNFRITSTGTTTIDLAWNGSSGATSYRIWYGTNASGSGAKLITVSGTSTRISGLKSKTRYYVDIAAANASGWSSYTPRISGTTK